MVTVTAVDQGSASTIHFLGYDATAETTSSTSYVDATNPHDQNVDDDEWYWGGWYVDHNTGGPTVYFKIVEGSSDVFENSYPGTGDFYSNGSSYDDSSLRAWQNTQGSTQLVKMQIRVSSGTPSWSVRWYRMVIMTPTEKSGWTFIDIANKTSPINRKWKLYADTFSFAEIGGTNNVTISGQTMRPADEAIQTSEIKTTISEYDIEWTTSSLSELMVMHMSGTKFQVT
jgi:hypothetical protein